MQLRQAGKIHFLLHLRLEVARKRDVSPVKSASLVCLLPLVLNAGEAKKTAAAPEANASNEVQVIDLSRLQPPEKDLLDEAVTLQNQKNPGRAINVLSDLLRYYPEGKCQQETLYRIALCYRDLGRFAEAVQTLDLLEKKAPKSDWGGPANLLRGEMLAADRKWKEAIPSLQKATTATLPEVQLRAHYLVVLASDNINQLEPARTNLEFLIRKEKDNPWRDYGRLKLGALEVVSGNNERAAQLLKNVLSSTNDAALRAEAGVRAGNLAYSLKNYREAAGFYEVVRRTEAPEFWKKLAHLGLIQSNFAAGDYAAVLQVFNEVKPAFPEAARAQAFFLAAEASRLTHRDKDAGEQYEFILKEFPGDPVAEPSLWARILLLKNSNTDEFLSETARFIIQFPKSERLPLVELMRADALYEKGDYKAAAGIYPEVLKTPEVLKSLKPEVQAGVYFRSAWSSYSVKDYDLAAARFDDYLKKFPGDGLRPQALWLKGLAEIQLKKNDVALQSWQELIDTVPKFEQRELLLWQAAMLAAGQKKSSCMETWLGLLLVEYPKSVRAAEAHYWLALARQDASDDLAALTHWMQARRLDSGKYYATATPQIIRVLLQKQNLKDLRMEVDAYDQWRLKNPQSPAIAINVYEWLGQQLMEGSGTESMAAEMYFRKVLASSNEPSQRKRVQLKLAMLMSQLKNYGAAIREWKIYRINFPDEANRSAVLEPLAKACIEAADFDMAVKLADQILEQNPEGEYNARGRLLLGDIALARHDYAEAGRLYSAVSLLMDDPVLTPLALAKGEKAWRQAGDEKKADQILLRLKKQYPDYKMPGN